VYKLFSKNIVVSLIQRMYRAHNPTAPGMHNMGGTYGGDSYSYGGAGGSHTNVTYRRDAGYFERVGGSCCGIFFGILLLLTSFPVLFLNEGRAVQTAKSLDEGFRLVQHIQSDDPIFDSNENQLVHLTGALKTEMALSDSQFDISIYAVKLRRSVEMYQWVEHSHKREYKEGDRTRVETTYSYTTEWKGDIIKSNAFSNPTAHTNPTSFPINSYTKVASPVFVGQHQLSSGLISKVSNFKTLQPKHTPVEGNFQMLENYIYRSNNPYSPKVGDLRISFSYAGHSDHVTLKQDHVSIIAKQNSGILTAFQTEAGDVLEMLYHGIKTAKEIFDSEHSANSMLTWVLRGVGWLLMFISLQMIMSIFRQIVSFIPIVRDIVGLATSLIAFSIATSLALITIAIGWLRYRPMLACALLVGAAIPLYLSKKKAGKDKMEKK